MCVNRVLLSSLPVQPEPCDGSGSDPVSGRHEGLVVLVLVVCLEALLITVYISQCIPQHDSSGV